MTTRAEILETAAQCVTKDREEQYGGMEDNFALIAYFWNIYERSKLNSEGKKIYTVNTPYEKEWTTSYLLDAHDVAIMMCLLKIARIASGQVKMDNYIDLAGYAACAGEIAGKGEAE